MRKIVSSVLLLIAASFAFAKETGYMLRNNGPLRVANDKNGVVWGITVPEMTKLTFVTGKIEVKDLVTKNETIKDCNFYKVTYEGKEYYAFERDVFIDSAKESDKVGVIVEDATLFSSKKPSSFRNACLERGTKVLTFETVSYLSFKFTKVAFYDTKEKVAKIRFVQSKKVSTEKNDIAVLEMIEKALAEKDEEFKKDQIKLVKNKKCSPAIHEYAESVYNKIFGIVAESETEDDDDDFGGDRGDEEGDEEFSAGGLSAGVYYVTSDNVNCRADADLSSSVVRQYSTGEEVIILYSTTQPETIGSDTGYWAYIEDTGWIFSAFIERR